MKNPVPETVDEIFYPSKTIKILTPYLDDIVENSVRIETHNEKARYLTLRHRSFAWYFCFNNNNKTDAYRRAFFGRFNRRLNQLVIQENLISNKKSVPVTARELMKRVYIQEAISRINKVIEAELKQNLPVGLLQQLIIQATYDPSMFIAVTGKPKFESWDEIPQEYRCCVEGIETRAYGKDANVTKTVLKLIDRDKARKILIQMCPSLLEPITTKHIFTTLDENGNEIGLQDYKKLSVEELLELEQNLKKGIIEE